MATKLTGALGIVVIALLACGEPYPRVLVQVRLPPGGAPDPARLHVQSDNSSDRSFVPHMSSAGWTIQKTLPGGFEIQLDTGIGPRRYVYAHVWYDDNGNGRLDSGDDNGDLAPAPFEARDPGGCSSPTNRAPPIVLKRVP